MFHHRKLLNDIVNDCKLSLKILLKTNSSIISIEIYIFFKFSKNFHVLDYKHFKNLNMKSGKVRNMINIIIEYIIKIKETLG